MVYFDNAATAGWRPDSVGEAVLRTLRDVSANPGRSGHRLALEAARVVEDARREVAAAFGVSDPARVAFTKNATEAVNIALLGRLREGDLVLASSWEHNAVMRPLRWLEASRGVRLEIVPGEAGSPVDLEWLERKLAAEAVRLVAIQTASNVTGEVMPVGAAGALCRTAGVFFLVDAAQGAGVLDIDVERDCVDALALTGHKSLFGPPGTGALCLRRPETVEPLLRGGTGSRSEEETQPEFPPDRFEAGTPNVPGLAGLAAGVRYLKELGPSSVRECHTRLAGCLLESLRGVPGLELRGPCDPERQLAVVSFTLEGMQADEVARELDRAGVMCRPGLHCAPRAHRTLGTFPGGTVRFSLSHVNTEEEIAAAARAVRDVAGQRRTTTTEARRHGERQRLGEKQGPTGSDLTAKRKRLRRLNRGRRIRGPWLQRLTAATGVPLDETALLPLQETERIRTQFFEAVKDTEEQKAKYWRADLRADAEAQLHALSSRIAEVNVILFSSVDEYVGAVTIPIHAVLENPFAVMEAIEWDLAFATHDLRNGLCFGLEYYDGEGEYVQDGVYELVSWGVWSLE